MADDGTRGRPRAARRTPVARIAALVVLSALLVGGCSTSSTSDGRRTPPDLPTDPVDTTEPGFDPAEQLATANDLRDQLTAAGIDCQGEAVTPTRSDGRVDIGVLASVECEPDGDRQIQIAVYRTEQAQHAGMQRLAFLTCAGGGPLTYVDGGAWAVGAVVGEGNATDPELTEEIGRALDAPVRPVGC